MKKQRSPEVIESSLGDDNSQVGIHRNFLEQFNSGQN